MDISLKTNSTGALMEVYPTVIWYALSGNMRFMLH